MPALARFGRTSTEHNEQQGGEEGEGVFHSYRDAFHFTGGWSPCTLASTSSEMAFRTASLERMLSQLKMQT